MERFKRNYESVREKMWQAAHRVGRDPRAIGLVAVSKTADDETVATAVKLGLRDFGENRVANLLMRSERFPGLRWHMIGQLQSNKVKSIIGHSYLIHSLDRWPLAEAIEHHSAQLDIVTTALIEVNVAAEVQKAGIALEDLDAFIDAVGALPHVQIRGLMCMAPMSEEAEKSSREVFRILADRFRFYRSTGPEHISMEHLSMGMSQDFEIAIEEGATLVRVGSALFDG